MTDLYYRLNDGLNDVAYKFYPMDKDVQTLIVDRDRDWYKSIFYYTKEQVEEASKIIEVKNTKGNIYKRIRGIGGITDNSNGTRYKTIEDVKSNILPFDFDSSNIELSQEDTRTLYHRLLDKGFKDEQIQISFSGGKGFSVVVETDTFLNPNELKSICSVLGEGLSTFDPKIYNASRLFRVPITKHHSGLYKMPIPSETLLEHTVNEIKDIATNRIDPNNIKDFYQTAELPEEIYKYRNHIVENKVDQTKMVVDPAIENLDWNNRQKFLTPEKWVLTNGLGYGEGERHDAYMILAASFKSAGFKRDQAGDMIKRADERHCIINKREAFDEEELWFNILDNVFSDSWQGGTYGQGHPIIARINRQLPGYLRNKKQEGFVDGSYIQEKLKKFVKDIDKNTIQLGVKCFDDKIRMLTGTSVGILGVPGSAKTTLALNMLKNNSLKGEDAAFYSLDMNESLVGLTQMRNISGLSNEIIWDLLKDDPNRYQEISKGVEDTYENVKYSFRYGVTPADIRNDILDYEQNTGKKMRLVVVDYLENVQSGYTDPTIGAGVVAQQLANVAAELEVLIVILLQTQKSVKPGDPIESMRSIKGASVIEQSLSLAIGIHREGQQLAYKDYDNFLTANILKNRFGPLATITMAFNGRKAEIKDMTKDQKLAFQDLLDMKKEDREDKENEKGGW